METSGNLLYIYNRFSNDLLSFQQKFRIFSKVPGRATFYRALSCYFRARMATNDIHPFVSKNSRGVILLHVALNFNNLDLSKITPIEVHEVKTFIENATLSPLFLTLQKRDSFKTYICRGLNTFLLKKQSDNQDHTLIK